MAFDAAYRLADAAFNRAPNTDVFGNGTGAFATASTPHALGRHGFPFGTEFVVIVDTLTATGGDAPTIEVFLEATLDNGTTWRPVTSFKFNAAAGFQGTLVREVGQDFAAQEYADANIDVRARISPVSTNVSNNIAAAKLAAFLTSGARQNWGRAKTADTLYV